MSVSISTPALNELLIFSIQISYPPQTRDARRSSTRTKLDSNVISFISRIARVESIRPTAMTSPSQLSLQLLSRDRAAGVLLFY